MDALGILAFFLVFCLIVRWLVRREEERQFKIMLMRSMDACNNYLKVLEGKIVALQPAILKASKSFEDFGRALGRVNPHYIRDPHRRFENVESDLL